MFIILGVIIYIIIAILIFYIFSSIDLFEEYEFNYYYDFPIVTFFTSVFWIVLLPLLLIFCALGWIGDWICIYGISFYKKHEKKIKQRKVRNKND